MTENEGEKNTFIAFVFCFLVSYIHEKKKAIEKEKVLNLKKKKIIF